MKDLGEEKETTETKIESVMSPERGLNFPSPRFSLTKSVTWYCFRMPRAFMKANSFCFVWFSNVLILDVRLPIVCMTSVCMSTLASSNIIWHESVICSISNRKPWMAAIKPWWQTQSNYHSSHLTDQSQKQWQPHRQGRDSLECNFWPHRCHKSLFLFGYQHVRTKKYSRWDFR